MKILVTGSESFVGKELIKQCKQKNIEIIGIDMISKENLDYEYHQVDITSPNIINYIPDNVDVIVHLAALSKDPDCKGKAYECFENNVMGTLNLIKSSSNKKIKQFIFASSEWVYDKFENNEIKNEDHIINSHNLSSEYALSKLTSEINLHQQFLQDNSNVTILRFGIIYGPRKFNWSAVESIASQVKNNDVIKVESLNNGRRFIHISDIASGIINSFNLQGFNIINLTGNKLITIKDIIEISEKIFKKVVTIHEKNPSQITIRNPSNEKAKNLIKWNPEINLEDGIKNIQSFL